MLVQSTYRGLVTVPSDTLDVQVKRCRGFLCFTTAGDITVITTNGDTVTFKSVPLNTVIPVAITRIKATGTAATGLMALTNDEA